MLLILPDSGFGRLHARIDHPIGFSLEFNFGETRLVYGEEIIDLSDTAVVINLVAGGVTFVRPTIPNGNIDYIDRIVVTSEGYMNEKYPTFLLKEANLLRALSMADQASKLRRPN